jgi:uncharacterized membrane protein HdeD (DUF308 family)
MPSFKLDTTSSMKQQFVSGGALLIILGIVVFFILPGYIPMLISGVGALMLIGGFFASK